MTAMRSDMVSASLWSWVTYTNVIPTSRWIRFSSICIAWRSFRSRAPRGSSSSSARGLLTSARASATRCCWPPESSSGRRFATPLELDQLDHLAHPRARPPPWPTFLRRRPKAMLSNTRHMREERVILEHHVDVPLVGRHRRHVLAVQQHRPLEGRVLEPGDHPQRRRLAAARGAEQGEELALADRQVEALDGRNDLALGGVLLAHPDQLDRRPLLGNRLLAHARATLPRRWRITLATASATPAAKISVPITNTCGGMPTLTAP